MFDSSAGWMHAVAAGRDAKEFTIYSRKFKIQNQTKLNDTCGSMTSFPLMIVAVGNRTRDRLHARWVRALRMRFSVPPSGMLQKCRPA